MKKPVVLGFAIAIALSLLSGCGASQPSTASSGSGSLSSTPASSSVSAGTQATLDGYVEAINTVNNQTCMEFIDLSTVVLDNAMQSVRVGDVESATKVRDAYSALCDELPVVYSAPEEAKSLYGYLNVWGGYELRVLDSYVLAAEEMAKGNESSALSIVDGTTSDLNSAVEAAQSYSAEYARLVDEYKKLGGDVSKLNLSNSSD